MPRATRWLLLVPLFLCLAGLYAVAPPRAMAGYANPKFVYEHTNAEDMSCDRNRAGADAQRVLFWQILGTGEDARRAEKPLTWREVIHLWRASEDFRDVFFESLNEEWCYGLRDYLWECAPVSSKTLDNKYEHVVKDRGYACGFGARDGPEVFREHFRTARAKGEDVAVFPNLGGDAVLVAPVQNAGGLETDAGACVREFAKSAPRRLRHDVLRVLGDAVHEKISDAPLWVSTNGAGVAWLHVRLDSTPKYYSYRPYTKLLLNGYDDAVKLEKDEKDSEERESESR
jgi:hypothetical protein